MESVEEPDSKISVFFEQVEVVGFVVLDVIECCLNILSEEGILCKDVADYCMVVLYLEF